MPTPRSFLWWATPWVALGLTAAGCTTVTPARAPVDAAGAVRVATYNVNYGLSGDRAGIDAALATGADVILYQEVTAGWAQALTAAHQAESGATCRFTAAADAGGLGVCARYPIEVYEVLDNPISWFPAARVVIKTPTGPVQLLNVHLRPPFSDEGVWHGIFGTPAIRHDELAMFMAFLDEDLPTVVAGDFNEWSGDALDLLEARGFASVAAMFHADDDDHTWRWPLPVVGEVTQRLDHIFVNDRLAVQDAWVVYQGRSDHFPVATDVVGR